MGWFSNNEDRLRDSYDALEENLSQNNKSPVRGFNDEAMKLRGGKRGRLKHNEEYGEQILEEEADAIAEDCSNYETSESGEGLARKVVNKPFWRR